MEVVEELMVNFREIANSSLASQSKKELHILLIAVSEYFAACQVDGPKHVLEIGVHKGYSMDVWRQAFSPEVLVGIDKDLSFVEVPGLECIEGDSTDESVIDQITFEIDFLFIDGGHLYNEVKRDFELYSPLVGSPGVIAFHDISREGPQWVGNVEVSKFWKEIKDEYNSVEVIGGAPDDPGVGVLFL